MIHSELRSALFPPYQVDRITVRHVPVLSSSVLVVDSARDLGVVIDNHLTMVDHVPRYLLSSAATTPDYKIPVCRCSKDTRAELHYMSSRLLQRSAHWHHRQSVQAPTVCAERGSATRHRYSST